MAASAITTTLVGRSPRGKQVMRIAQTSAAATALTLAVPGGPGRRLLQVTVAYSAAPTQAGVSAALNSGAGAGYDSTLNTGSANAQFTNYMPDGEVFIGNDDSLDVTAPSGGGVITAAIAVYVEQG